MSQHASYLVREFLELTQWNTWDNHYGTLTQPSRQLLDFAVPVGVSVTTASHPTRSLAPSLTLATLVPQHDLGTQPTYPPTPAPTIGGPVNPLLAGQLAYLFTSAPLDHLCSKRAAQGSDRIAFQNVAQSYPIGALPLRPELRDDARPTWHAGRMTTAKDYLLYGRLYAPSPRLDALYIRRISPTLQGLVSLITVPSPAPPPTLTWESGDPTASLSASATTSAAAAAAAAGPTSGPLARLSELELKLQHDTGRWSTEYSYAVGDGMWGVRGLYNFGRHGDPGGMNTPTPVAPQAGGAGPLELADEEAAAAREAAAIGANPFGGLGQNDETPTGLKGRWSAGGEIYFSAQERSAGVSTALRFVTIPESAGAPPNQPPTYVTATLNPIMGQLSTAYAVQADRDTRFASRFDFNLYSYESDLTVGAEWFQRRTLGQVRETSTKGKAKALDQDATDVGFDAFGRGKDDEDTRKRRMNHDADDEVLSVLKFRASTTSDLALLWEGRMGDFLVSAGVVADLRLATRGRMSPIRSVGLGLSYWG